MLVAGAGTGGLTKLLQLQYAGMRAHAAVHGVQHTAAAAATGAADSVTRAHKDFFPGTGRWRLPRMSMHIYT